MSSCYNYKVANGKTRALVCYCETSDGALMRDTIKAVFAAQAAADVASSALYIFLRKQGNETANK